METVPDELISFTAPTMPNVEVFPPVVINSESANLVQSTPVVPIPVVPVVSQIKSDICETGEECDPEILDVGNDVCETGEECAEEVKPVEVKTESSESESSSSSSEEELPPAPQVWNENHYSLMSFVVDNRIISGLGIAIMAVILLRFIEFY